MTTLIIDGEEQKTAGPRKTLGDLVAAADERSHKSGRIVTALRLDGDEAAEGGAKCLRPVRVHRHHEPLGIGPGGGHHRADLDRPVLGEVGRLRQA